LTQSYCGSPNEHFFDVEKAFQNSTVTTHSYTKNIEEITVQADIIITALGVPNYLKAKW
jgi:5,10-methylene-tetrahydrofolate dehydrogenase/methenyl tetrahydrofolate cyclohydrolase